MSADPVTGREQKLIDAMQRIVDQVDDGAPHCVGVESSGKLVWKGSFLSRIEDARDLLPPTTERQT